MWQEERYVARHLQGFIWSQTCDFLLMARNIETFKRPRDKWDENTHILEDHGRAKESRQLYRLNKQERGMWRVEGELARKRRVRNKLCYVQRSTLTLDSPADDFVPLPRDVRAVLCKTRLRTHHPLCIHVTYPPTSASDDRNPCTYGAVTYSSRIVIHGRALVRI